MMLNTLDDMVIHNNIESLNVAESQSGRSAVLLQQDIICNRILFHAAQTFLFQIHG